MILKKILSQVGIDDIVEAGHGVEALERLETNGDAALALLDWNMPVMDGYQLLQEIRSRRALDGMRVMMVTTETEISQVERALAAGANEYVMKPFSHDTIKEKLTMMGLGTG